MRAQEFVTEREDWVHMDPPEIAKWRNELRVQDIKSGPESTFSMTAPPSTRKDPRVPLGPDSPFADSKSLPSPLADKKHNSELYKDAPNDEYRAMAPKRWGGKIAPPDQTELQKRKSKYSTEINPDYLRDKQGDFYDPAKPVSKKEKYRT